MRNGTQEELDAAKEDARLSPRDALFRVNNTGEYKDYKFAGVTVGAVVHRRDGLDGPDSVGFSVVDSIHDGVAHCSSGDLEVINDN